MAKNLMWVMFCVVLTVLSTLSGCEPKEVEQNLPRFFITTDIDRLNFGDFITGTVM